MRLSTVRPHGSTRISFSNTFQQTRQHCPRRSRGGTDTNRRTRPRSPGQCGRGNAHEHRGQPHHVKRLLRLEGDASYFGVIPVSGLQRGAAEGISGVSANGGLRRQVPVRGDSWIKNKTKPCLYGPRRRVSLGITDLKRLSVSVATNALVVGVVRVEKVGGLRRILRYETPLSSSYSKGNTP